MLNHIDSCLLFDILMLFHRFPYSVTVVDGRKRWSAQKLPGYIRGQAWTFLSPCLINVNMKGPKSWVYVLQVRSHRHGQ